MHSGVGDFRSVSGGFTTQAKPSGCCVSGAKPISVECWMPFARGDGFLSLTIRRTCRPKTGLRRFGTETGRGRSRDRPTRLLLLVGVEDRAMRLGSAPPCLNQRYDRRHDEVSRDELQRIVI